MESVGLGESEDVCEGGPDFQGAAFAAWVPRFASVSRRLSGLCGLAGRDEVAAYRGFFARRRPGVRNVLMLHAHLCPQADRGDAEPDKIERLLADPLSADELHAAFLRLAPFGLGNRRCARALRMSRHLAAGDGPQADRIWTDCEAAFGAEPAVRRRQFTRRPAVSPYVIQTFGSA